MPGTETKQTLVERLFAEHRDALQGFFRRRIRSKADAADLTQEVYLRLLRIRDQEAIRSPVPYLYTVASNLVKEHAVLDARRAAGVNIDDASHHEQLEVLPSFDGEVDAEARATRLRMVLAQLRPKCQAAVQLRFAQGLSYQEIGAQLGISAQMARKYVLAAIAHCTRRMQRVR
jgi:RNA polymerase sigma-70 factor (ECF subfamily)